MSRNAGQAHTWALCSGFFEAQYRSGKPYIAAYSSLLGTAVHELVAAFDRPTGGEQHDLDDVIGRNWHAGRFAGADDGRARDEAKTLLAAYAALRETETVRVLGNEVFCQTRPRVLRLARRCDRETDRHEGTASLCRTSAPRSASRDRETDRHEGTASPYRLSAGTRLPQGLDIKADGIDVKDGTLPLTHHTTIRQKRWLPTDSFACLRSTARFWSCTASSTATSPCGWPVAPPRTTTPISKRRAKISWSIPPHSRPG